MVMKSALQQVSAAKTKEIGKAVAWAAIHALEETEKPSKKVIRTKVKIWHCMPERLG